MVECVYFLVKLFKVCIVVVLGGFALLYRRQLSVPQVQKLSSPMTGPCPH